VIRRNVEIISSKSLVQCNSITICDFHVVDPRPVYNTAPPVLCLLQCLRQWRRRTRTATEQPDVLDQQSVCETESIPQLTAGIVLISRFL
jgi:hypothetical protein